MATQQERIDIAVLQEQMKTSQKDICDIKGTVDKIEAKLDSALLNKADKSEVKALQDKVEEVNLDVRGLVIKIGLIIGILIAAGEIIAKSIIKW